MSTIAELATAATNLANAQATVSDAQATFAVAFVAVNDATLAEAAVLQQAQDIFNVAFEAAKETVGYNEAFEALTSAQASYNTLRTTLEQTMFELQLQ